MDLPREIRSLIIQYGLPINKDDLEILYHLGATKKDLSIVFENRNWKEIEQLVKIISLPEETYENVMIKLNKALESDNPYYPLVKHLYSQIRYTQLVGSLTDRKVYVLSLINRDNEFARDISTRISFLFGRDQIPRYSIYRSLRNDIWEKRNEDFFSYVNEDFFTTTWIYHRPFIGVLIRDALEANNDFVATKLIEKYKMVYLYEGDILDDLMRYGILPRKTEVFTK